MNNISTTFSIKDLENLSGIKAHTIRIWEKRYNILVPERTDTNIRLYNLKNLQKLLNVTYLNNHGVKISKIAKMSEEEIKTAVKEHAGKNGDKNHFLDELKVAMLSYDQYKFEQTYNKIISEISFREMFLEVFIPMLEYIGIHWQSDSITPAHEHFISNLIMQKLLINIERVQQSQAQKDKVFALFLPENEIHELGLLYLNYELSLEGYQTIYLGSSVPMDNLLTVVDTFEEVNFVSYFTVSPVKDDVQKYLDTIEKEVLSKKKSKFFVLGRNAQYADKKGKSVKVFTRIDEFINKI